MFSLIFCSLAFANPQVARYPLVSDVQGKVLIKTGVADHLPAKKGQWLTTMASIKTETGAWVKVRLDENSTVVVGPGSSVDLPIISDDSWVERIVVASGQIRYQPGVGRTRWIETPISRGAYLNGDYWLEYTRSLGRVELTVLSGETSFSGLEAEEELKLKAGQRGIFQADIEDGAPVFDIMLKGKKIVRGKLFPLVEVPAGEIAGMTKTHQFVAPKVIAKPEEVKKAKESLCQKPYGKLDECAWVCEGNPKSAKNCLIVSTAVVCVRYRCNANGEWADRFELSKQQSSCRKNPVVGKCDY